MRSSTSTHPSSSISSSSKASSNAWMVEDKPALSTPQPWMIELKTRPPACILEAADTPQPCVSFELASKHLLGRLRCVALCAAEANRQEEVNSFDYYVRKSIRTSQSTRLNVGIPSRSHSSCSTWGPNP
ncbi:hypothetical protein GW17_00040278 [Ensete ventricosum]|nr:hypothetical protein GW17_00040278 [Ensete ventricosum]